MIWHFKFLLTTCLFFKVSSYSFSQINQNLKHQLDSISRLDLIYRNEVNLIMTNQQLQDSILFASNKTLEIYVQEIMLKQELLDESNLKWIDSIIKIYGYPGKKLVGIPTNDVTWSILQHSYDIDKHLKLIKKASKCQDISSELYAKMIDRNLMHKGRRQLYGTQFECIPNEKGDLDCKLYTIKRKSNVNKRRKKMGFSTTVEEHAKELGITKN